MFKTSTLMLSLLAAGLVGSVSAAPVEPQSNGKIWITVGDRAFSELKRTLPGLRSIASSEKASSLAHDGSPASRETVHALEVSESHLLLLSGLVHEKLKRCGGYIAHSSRAEALNALKATPKPMASRPSYTLDNQAVINAQIGQLQDSNIANTITQLSNFTNRYYTTSHGTNASNWIMQQWQTLANGRSDVTVEQITHSGYAQKSVILTIKGTDNASEVVVLGGHMDSIHSSGTSESTRAPGADDDASGIASLTEALRVMMANNYKPRRSIKFMAYAAEEVGLRGSQDIAQRFKAANTNVVGVMQLDMTNYKGSVNDIYIYTDYTDASQNSFISNLITTYQPTLKIGSDKCGYGCSDHASWYNQGYVASLPFESAFSGDNPYIHTSNDTYANMGSQAQHALKFARLAFSYAVELGSDGPVIDNTKTETFSGSLTKGQKANFGPFKAKLGSFNASTTGTGDPDLYVKTGSAPTTSSYSCKSDGGTATENCTVNLTANGDVYVMLNGYSASTYKLTVKYLPQTALK